MQTLIPLLLGAAAVGYTICHNQLTQLRRRRIGYIQDYVFPPRVLRELKRRYPHLDDPQCERVISALRQYFIISLLAKGKMVAMPSQAVDIAWHEFILDTRLYRQFCRRAFGRFFHHTPAESLPGTNAMQEGRQRAWRLSCSAEGINAKHPARLPLLFALDSELAIPDGFTYDYLTKGGLRQRKDEGDDVAIGGGCSGGSSSSSKTSDYGHDSSGDSGGGDGGCGGGCGGS